jgi:chromosome segregation ATPase
MTTNASISQEKELKELKDQREQKVPSMDEAAEEAVQRYIRSRVYPAFVAGAAVLAALGWSIDKQLAAAQDTVASQVKKADERLGEMNRAIDNANTRIKTLESDMHLLALRLKGDVELQRSSVERSSNENAAWLKESRDKINAETAVLTNLRIQRTELESRILVLEKRAQEADSQIANGMEVANQLNRLVDLQSRILSASVIEYLTMRSESRSAIIDLPYQAGTYKLQFITPNIKESFNLTYSLDGQERTITVSNADKWTWYPIVGTQGGYEFKVDHVFHAAGEVPDFVALRVRSTDALAGTSLVPARSKVPLVTGIRRTGAFNGN